MVEVGDHFVYKSKYGGIVEGIVGSIKKHLVINTELNYVTIKYVIESTTGVHYDFNEISIVTRKISEKEQQTWEKIIKNIDKHKKNLKSGVAFKNKIKNDI